jgi:hypothetical protein
VGTAAHPAPDLSLVLKNCVQPCMLHENSVAIRSRLQLSSAACLRLYVPCDKPKMRPVIQQQQQQQRLSTDLHTMYSLV